MDYLLYFVTNIHFFEIRYYTYPFQGYFESNESSSWYRLSNRGHIPPSVNKSKVLLQLFIIRKMISIALLHLKSDSNRLYTQQRDAVRIGPASINWKRKLLELMRYPLMSRTWDLNSTLSEQTGHFQKQQHNCIVVVLTQFICSKNTWCFFCV